MNLYNVIKNNDIKAECDTDEDIKNVNVTSIEIDNRQCREGSLF